MVDSSSCSDVKCGENKIICSISQMHKDINLKFAEVNVSEVKGLVTSVNISINELKTT